jgi:NPCBM/NEW2 domain
MTYLSDLNPTKVEETPFFGRRLPWRRNVNLLGEPLKMNGQTYDRGVAVHSRCNLTYDLNREYSTFEALVGFDEAVKGLGRVDCRVFADGKEIYANPDLRADGPPVKLSLPVAGADQLRLMVDFGRDQDTGDRVIFANPRLHRQPPSTASTTETSSHR